MPAWSCPSRPAPRTSPATQGQAKSCLHVQRSDAAFQGGPQRVRVCSCVPRTQIKCALGRGGQRRGGGWSQKDAQLVGKGEPLPAPCCGPWGSPPQRRVQDHPHAPSLRVPGPRTALYCPSPFIHPPVPQFPLSCEGAERAEEAEAGWVAGDRGAEGTARGSLSR